MFEIKDSKTLEHITDNISSFILLNIFFLCLPSPILFIIFSIFAYIIRHKSSFSEKQESIKSVKIYIRQLSMLFILFSSLSFIKSKLFSRNDTNFVNNKDL